MNLSVLCLYEINKKFTSGSQKFLLFEGKAKRGCEYIMIFFPTDFRGDSAGSERWVLFRCCNWKICNWVNKTHLLII